MLEITKSSLNGICSLTKSLFCFFTGLVFTGIIEQATRDHIVISNPSTGKWYLLLMVYLNYVEFDEKINYITF